MIAHRNLPTRRDFLTTCAAIAVSPTLSNLAPEPSLIAPEDLDFLSALAKATIASATKSVSLAKLGFPVITPGGAYPAFWIRDFSMAAGCGLISTETLANHVRLIAQSQNGPVERNLSGRAIIPPHAIPDHINYDGGAVFYPGTYSSGDDQGGEPYGLLPPVDDHFEFIHLSYLLWKQTKNPDFLKESINGISLFNRLELALNCPAADPKTRLVITEAKTRAVGFGFCDGIYFTGSLLFASLLRFRALGEMSELAVALKRKPADWNQQRSLISKHLIPIFGKNGWLKAATEVGQQADVWGTVYAVYLGAVKGSAKSNLRNTIAQAVRNGTITYRGAVRHVPTDQDFSPTSAWERTAGEPLNQYQNGAYWHVPSGYLARVLWSEDKPLARQMVKDMIAHFREEDFRLGNGKGAPWECLHATKDYRQNPIYMASVTLPLEALT